MGKSQLTEEIDAFETRLRSVDGSKRTPTDQNLVQLTHFLLQMSHRIDKLEDDK